MGGGIVDEPGSISVFTFPPQERVIFGKGAVGRVASEMDRLGRQRALVITGTTIATKTDLLEGVRKILGHRFAGMFYPISQHVPRRDVLAAAFQAREAKADILISLGGGSPVDGSKAVALCLSEGVTQEKELESYRVRGPRGMRSAPHSAGILYRTSPSPPRSLPENSRAGSASPTKPAVLRKAMEGRNSFPGWSSSTRNSQSIRPPGFGRQRECAPWTTRWKGFIPPDTSR